MKAILIINKLEFAYRVGNAGVVEAKNGIAVNWYKVLLFAGIGLSAFYVFSAFAAPLSIAVFSTEILYNPSYEI